VYHITTPHHAGSEVNYGERRQWISYGDKNENNEIWPEA
jgi:hypothetical protein